MEIVSKEQSKYDLVFNAKYVLIFTDKMAMFQEMSSRNEEIVTLIHPIHLAVFSFWKCNQISQYSWVSEIKMILQLNYFNSKHLCCSKSWWNINWYENKS